MSPSPEDCKHPYLGSLVSEISRDIRDLREYVRGIQENDNEAHQLIYKKIDNVETTVLAKIEEIERDVFTAKTVIKFSKMIILTVFAVLAFKFGDINSIWGK